ncbi:hypothetical protein Pfo_024124 [Paulownia fortunei]|nr:hypothetical protein Pfo_024124 [Paulownia fortunei]
MEAEANTELHPLPQDSVGVTEVSPELHPLPQDSVDATEDPENEDLMAFHFYSAPVQDWDNHWQENVEFFIVRVKAENGEIIGNIPQMEAVCKICYTLLNEDIISVLSSECRCTSTLSLLHEKCALENPEKKKEKCDDCEEVIQYIPVTLSKANGENLENPTSSKRTGSCFPKLFRPKND